MADFHAKVSSLLTDHIRGISKLHPDSAKMLDFVCDFSKQSFGIVPVVTEFGRTKNDQEAIYAPTIFQALAHHGISDKSAWDSARQRARDRFSWHCIDKATGLFRAFDLRDWVYTEAQRLEIVKALRSAFPHGEILDHKVPGGSMHFHVGAPDPLGKPQDWL